MKASKSRKYGAKLGATLPISGITQHRDRLDNPGSAFRLITFDSIMKVVTD